MRTLTVCTSDEWGSPLFPSLTRAVFGVEVGDPGLLMVYSGLARGEECGAALWIWQASQKS